MSQHPGAFKAERTQRSRTTLLWSTNWGVQVRNKCSQRRLPSINIASELVLTAHWSKQWQSGTGNNQVTPRIIITLESLIKTWKNRIKRRSCQFQGCVVLFRQFCAEWNESGQQVPHKMRCFCLEFFQGISQRLQYTNSFLSETTIYNWAEI